MAATRMSIFVLNSLQRAEGIALAGPSLGEFGAADQVVDAREHLIEARIDVVDIHADRDAMIARDAGGACDGGRVMSIDVQHTRARNLLRSDVRRVDGQTIRAMPEDGALAGGLIDDDVGALIGATGADLDVVQIEAGFAQAGHLDAAAFVVADSADVLGPQPELAAGDERAGHLAPGAHDLAFEGDLTAELRVFWNQQKRVGGVEADADQIEGGHRHWFLSLITLRMVSISRP